MDARLPTITLLFAGLNALLAVFLATRVTALRARLKINVGDGNNPKLIQTIRVHANNAEYVPLALVLFALCEIVAGGGWPIWMLGGGLLVGRILHAQGYIQSTGPTFGRIVGQTLTWLVIAAGALYAIYLYARLAG